MAENGTPLRTTGSLAARNVGDDPLPLRSFRELPDAKLHIECRFYADTLATSPPDPGYRRCALRTATA